MASSTLLSNNQQEIKEENMDIFEYAKEFDADYYDPVNCVIYKVQDYNRKKKLNQTDDQLSMEVVDLDGNVIGYIHKK